MNYATEPHINKGAFSAPSNSVSLPVKADGLTSCLQRIQEATGALYANNERLASLAVRIGGHEPEQAGKDSPPQPMPDNALFLARQIEGNLQSIIDFQRYQMNRIENAIG